jgi:hypothetical protein
MMPNQRLTYQERLDHSLDYLQRYYRSFLNEEEQHRFQQLKTMNSVASGAFAILFPFTLIYSISTKYNHSAFYTKSLQCFIMLGTLGVSMNYIHGKQKEFQTAMANKYFS